MIDVPIADVIVIWRLERAEKVDGMFGAATRWVACVEEAGEDMSWCLRSWFHERKRLDWVLF